MFPINRKFPRLSTIYLLSTLCLTVWVAFGRPSPQPQTAVASVGAIKVAPSVTAKPNSRIIEIGDAQLGQRTLGKNPIREQVEPIEPDSQTWRKLSLEMRKDGGLRLWVELLRSLDWIADYEAEVGGTIFLDLEEMGVVGDATVTAIDPCPPIQPGTGAVITGKFVHESDGQNVVELRIEGQPEPTVVTSSHRYWSADRQDYVAVSDLRPGESVDTEHGHRRVVSITPIMNFEGQLYNLETTEHVYRVGSSAVLAHNTCAGQHHIWPRSWGNRIPYKHKSLPPLSEKLHTHVHKAFDEYLQKKFKKKFLSQKGDDWKTDIGSRAEAEKLMSNFVTWYGKKYPVEASRIASSTKKTLREWYKEQQSVLAANPDWFKW